MPLHLAILPDGKNIGLHNVVVALLLMIVNIVALLSPLGYHTANGQIRSKCNCDVTKQFA